MEVCGRTVKGVARTIVEGRQTGGHHLGWHSRSLSIVVVMEIRIPLKSDKTGSFCWIETGT